MVPRFSELCIDAADIHGLGSGGRRKGWPARPPMTATSRCERRRVRDRLAFLLAVPEGKTVQEPPAYRSDTGRSAGRGRARARPGSPPGRHRSGDQSWVVLADPEGNEFCIPRTGVGHPQVIRRRACRSATRRERTFCTFAGISASRSRTRTPTTAGRWPSGRSRAAGDPGIRHLPDTARRWARRRRGCPAARPVRRDRRSKPSPSNAFRAGDQPDVLHRTGPPTPDPCRASCGGRTCCSRPSPRPPPGVRRNPGCPRPSGPELVLPLCPQGGRGALALLVHQGRGSACAATYR